MLSSVRSKHIVIITELSNSLDYVTTYHQKPIEKNSWKEWFLHMALVPPQLSTPSLSPLQSLVLFQFLEFSKISPLNTLLFPPTMVYFSLGSCLYQCHWCHFLQEGSPKPLSQSGWGAPEPCAAPSRALLH